MTFNLGRWQFVLRLLPFHVHLAGKPPCVATVERRWIFGAWHLPRIAPALVYGLELGPIGLRWFPTYGVVEPPPWHVHRFREQARTYRWDLTPSGLQLIEVRKRCRCGARRWEARCDATAQWYRKTDDEIADALAHEDAEEEAKARAHTYAEAVRACGGSTGNNP